MLTWLVSNLPTVIICAVLVLVLVLIVAGMIRNKKKGKSACGCGCGGCSMEEICHKDKS